VSGPSAPQLRRSGAIRAVIALLCAAAVTLLSVVAAQGQLTVRTDVIGYPILANFNPFNYYWAYYLAVGLFPIASLLIFLGLTHIGPRLGLATPAPRGPVRPTGAAPQDALDRSLPYSPAIAVARIGFVGAVLGLEVGIAANHLLPSLPIVMLGYALAIGLGSVAPRAGGVSPERRLAAANAAAAPLTVAGLMLVSAHTQVLIAANGSTRHYSWFPLWLGLPLCTAALGWVVVSLRRAGPTGVDAIERRAVLLIAAPVALFLLLAHLPGDPGQINLFEQGQSLAEARLIGNGWLPWRDVVVTHGLLGDVGPVALGSAVFGNSYWGVVAAGSLLVHPISVVSTYFLLAYLVGRNWTLMIAAALIFLSPWLGATDPRFLLWPVVLLLLAAVLKNPSRLRASALAFTVLAQAIVTPETAPVVLAVTGVLVAYEWYWRSRGVPLVQAFRRTISYLVALAVFVAAFAIYMASRGGLGDVVYVTVNLVTGHNLVGALPPFSAGLTQAQFDFLAFAPPAAVLVSFAYAVSRIRLRRPFLTADWPMAVIALFVLVYYTKFLDRMDSGHVRQPFMLTTPLLIYIIYRAVTALEGSTVSRAVVRGLAPLRARPIGLVVLVLTVAFVWGALRSVVDGAPASYRSAVAQPAEFARVGFSVQVDSAAVADLSQIVNAYLGRSGRLQDLTDEPALFHYFIDRDPSTRWYVPNGIVGTTELQRNLISELRRAPPKLIVLDDTDQAMAGLANMDGAPVTVRLYLVSRWILDHYKPLLVSHGRTIYARPGVPPVSSLHLHLRQPPQTTGVPFSGELCDWGYSPTFLQGPADPPTGAQAVIARLASARGASLTVTGWAADLRTRKPARAVIAVIDGTIVGRSAPYLARPDVVRVVHQPGFLKTGFKLSIPAADADLHRMQLLAVAADGTVAALQVPGVIHRDRHVRVAGHMLRLQPAALTGHVDSTSPAAASLAIELPAGSTWANYRWLEVDAPNAGFGQAAFLISDQSDFSAAGRMIRFETLGRSPRRYIIPVSSCPQWHGYGSGSLFVTSSAGQQIAAVRLIR